MRIRSFKDFSEDVLASPPRLSDVRIIAVDGRTGSGKTTFTARLAAALRDTGAHIAVLHTDDLLNGWGHPTDFGPRLKEWVLEPLLAGGSARHKIYDWHRGRFSAEWTDLGRPEVLIVEGVTTASAAWRPTLTRSVFVSTDPQLCLRRGIARDGEELRGELNTWRAHEDVHFAQDRTWEHVDLVVDGAPKLAHDPQTEFVVIAP